VASGSDQVSNYPDYGRECLTSVVTETLLQVNLGYGVLVNASNLQLVSRQDPKKTTYTMCELLFTRSELANSSLTGKKSNAFKDKAIKEKLDEARVQALAGALGFWPNLLYATVMLYCTTLCLNMTHSIYAWLKYSVYFIS